MDLDYIKNNQGLDPGCVLTKGWAHRRVNVFANLADLADLQLAKVNTPVEVLIEADKLHESSCLQHLLNAEPPQFEAQHKDKSRGGLGVRHTSRLKNVWLFFSTLPRSHSAS